MAYCAAQPDLERAVGGLAKLVQLTAAPGGAVVDLVVAAAAIDEADTLINSYVEKVHAAPVTPAPASLKLLSAKIAARVLRRWKTSMLQTDVDDETNDRKWLEGVAKGDISLGVEPVPAASSMQVAKAGARDSTKNVSREKTKGFW
jgi:phage gp36-like protein